MSAEAEPDNNKNTLIIIVTGTKAVTLSLVNLRRGQDAELLAQL